MYVVYTKFTVTGEKVVKEVKRMPCEGRKHANKAVRALKKYPIESPGLSTQSEFFWISDIKIEKGV